MTAAISLGSSLFNLGMLAGGIYYTARILGNVLKMAAKQNESISFLAARLADIERERAYEAAQNYRPLKLG